MSVTVVFDRSAEVLAAIHAALGEAVRDTAEAIKQEAQRKVLDPPKTGRIYSSRNKPSPHQASAPGEAPATWTGNLVEAIDRRTISPLTEEVSVGQSADYAAKYLEFGSDGGKIAPRPFFYPTVDEQAEELPKRATAAVRKVT